MAENTKPPVLLVAPEKERSSERFSLLEKALASMAELRICADLPSDLSGIQHVFFFHTSPGNWTNSIRATLALSPEENFPAATNSVSLLRLNQPNLKELVRLLHSHLYPERSIGVAYLTEKGSLILGEKIQSLASLGRLLDQLLTHLQEHTPSLAPRAHDLQQLIIASVSNAFASEQAFGQEYPTVDFQVSLAPDKAVFSTRFRQTKASANLIARSARERSSRAWFLAWQCADALAITSVAAASEVEIKAVLFAQAASEALRENTLLTAEVKQLAPANLLAAPKNYSFGLIGDLTLHRFQRTHNATITRIEQKEESGPDEATRLKIDKLMQEKNSLNELVKLKEDQFRTAAANLSKARAELSAGKNNILKLLKEHENTNELKKKKISELELKVALLGKKLESSASAGQGEKTDNTQANDISKQYEQRIRALESERQKQLEANNLSNRKLTLLEQKISASQRELQTKEKEIADLKALLMKVKTLQPKTEAAEQTPAKEKEREERREEPQLKALAMRIRDMEAKEINYKQEIKKLQFQIENNKKSAEASSGETGGKLKLIEKKLEEAKAKERELLKKIDDLSQALKKVNRAA